MTILNIGCGTQTSADPNVVNIDWSPYLMLRRSRVGRAVAPLFLTRERRARFDSLDINVVAHDLSRGIPFPDNSVDAVYHSHFFEHLDRDVVPRFLDEVHRVLIRGGIHRIVVPDLERLCRQYLASLERSGASEAAAREHDSFVATLFEQSVRREAAGTSRQPPVRRWFENRILGDARKRGETHQWMYDRVNMTVLLREHGFREARVTSFAQSSITNWASLGLDMSPEGAEYKPGSLYIEATK